jgi:hypothetical protein
MPPLKPVNQVIQFMTGGSYQNQPWVNVYHWEYSGGTPTQANMTELCNDLLTAWDVHLGTQHHTSVTLNTVRAVDLSSPDAPQGANTNAGVAGDLSVGTALPVNVACVASWLTNYRWRGGHPRTYYPCGSSNSVQNGNSWTTVALTNFRVQIAAFMSAFNGITAGSISGHMVCVRRWQTMVKGQPPVELDPPLVLPIVGVVVDSRLDSQRRRLGRDVSA